MSTTTHHYNKASCPEKTMEQQANANAIYNIPGHRKVKKKKSTILLLSCKNLT